MANQRSDSRVSMLGMHFTLLEQTMWALWNTEQKRFYISNYKAMFSQISRELTAEDRASILATIEHMEKQIVKEETMRKDN